MIVSGFTPHLATAIGFLIVASAMLFAAMGVDDVVLDLAFWIHRWYRWIAARRYKRLTLEQLREQDQKRIAIFIPCWHEHDIVDKMVELACASLQYNRYDIYIGVYPNDPLTVEKAKEAAASYPRVQVVVNERDGPTTKAQNLNQMWHAMQTREGADRYEIVVLHDVEDVIHPLSLLLYNFLIPRRDMVQLPVFPLERPWNKWTAWTYADEFAENHLKDLVSRETFGSFVPCAGVGCGFNRDALEHTATRTGELFPTESLTEDYQLGLHFRQSGLSTIIVHQRLGFVRAEHVTTAAAYVATREYFPDTFITAVRQKARWIVGICFQAWEQTGWTGNIFTRYTLYRDRKAILSNLLVLLGYGVFALALGLAMWGRFDPAIAQPHVDRRWWPLLAAVLAFSVVRVLQKGYFVATIYGPRQGLLAMLRIPWAGVINACATARACFLFARSRMTGRPLVWSKTTHAFPTRAALSEYRRQLGEVLIEQELVSNDDVSLALEARRPGERIGETLVRLGYLTQRELTGAVARQIGAQDGSRDDLVPAPEVMRVLPAEEARRLRALPLRMTDRGAVVAVDDEPTAEVHDLLRKRLHRPLLWMITERSRLTAAIERSYAYDDERRKPLGVYLLDRGWLTRAQLERALMEQDRTHKGLFELVVDNGDISPDRARTVLEEYFGISYAEPPVGVRVAADAVMKLPARILRGGIVVPYGAGDELFIASPFPLDRATKEMIAELLPDAKIVAGPASALAPLRREVLDILKRRRQLGEMLVEEELVTTEQIARALEQRVEGERLGETLVRLGSITSGALDHALQRQAAGGRPPIGAFLVEQRYLTRKQLDDLLARQDRTHLPIFAMAIEAGLLRPQDAAHVIAEYFGTTYAQAPADAEIPLEYLQLIPTKLLREHTLTLYRENGGAVVAAPYPLPDALKDAIAHAGGSSVSFALCSAESIVPLRRRMLQTIDFEEIETVAADESDPVG